VKVGLQIRSFTWPGGPAAIADHLGRLVRTADDVGFDSIWLMDHFIQIRGVGRPTEPMLEGWTTLGWIAANTSRAQLGLLVGGVPYRQPAVWVKAATALDVLSGGRAWLGIGAAWNQEEAESLGIPFPPLAERFELLEDTVRLALAMWEGEHGSMGPLDGHHVRATRLLNAPQSISRPHVPIMIGGGGERRTLRLVARYADAANVFGAPEAIARKYRILEEHCVAVGRDFDEIERTTLQSVTLGSDGGRTPDTAAQVVDHLGELGDAGAQHVIVNVRGTHDPAALELIGRDVIPQLRAL